MATKSQKAEAAAVTRKREAAVRNPKNVTSATEIADAIRESAKAKRAAKEVPAHLLNSDVPKVTKAEAMAKVNKELKVPKTFGAMADALYTTRERRLNLQKEVDALAAFESKLKNKLIDEMPKKDSSGAAGKVARAQITQSDEPQAENWDELYKHIKKKGEFDLLNRAVNKSAVKARWDAGKEVPGVRHFTVTKVSVTKL
jgi:hypothetical protein